jgi:alginate O-acetyltransferase complex protein AlgJ
MPHKDYRSTRRLYQRVTASFLLAVIAMPLLGTWFRWDPWYGFNEKRELAAFPDWPRNYSQASSFLPDVLTFYRDNFGFRRSLIHGLAFTEVGFLHISSKSTVILGDDGWLYLRLTDGPGSSESSQLAPLSESELDRWQYPLEQRRAWLAKKHIAYLVVIVPEKQSIYPEFLPDGERKLQYEQWPSQLVGRLKNTGSPVAILDLQPYLFEAKSREQVYWKADTHWNQYGLYVGYRAMMDEIPPSVAWQAADHPRPGQFCSIPGKGCWRRPGEHAGCSGIVQ